MTKHEGKRHWELAQGLIGEHGDVPCYDAVVRCDHERAAVHAALAQAHALAAIAASLEQVTHQLAILIMEPVPADMGQVLTLAREPEPVPATSPAETDDALDWEIAPLTGNVETDELIRRHGTVEEFLP